MPIREQVFKVKTPTGETFETPDVAEAGRIQTAHPGSQLQTLSRVRNVEAQFAVVKKGKLVQAFKLPGEAAKLAGKIGGEVQLIPVD